MESFGRYIREGNACTGKFIRDLAKAAPGKRFVRMKLDGRVQRMLRRSLERAAELKRRGAEGESLLRLCAEARRMEGCLRCARSESRTRLPGWKMEARILKLAQIMVCGGERRLGAGEIRADIAAFENVRLLRMAELEAVPAALRIALCEALVKLGREIVQAGEERMRAEAWFRQGGRLPKDCGDVFLAHALQLCVEEECAARRKLEACEGLRAAVERACSQEADLCMRLDNLMALNLLLERLDWSPVFEEISAVEQELKQDAVYAGMDGASRAQLRMLLAEIAEQFSMEEVSVARVALHAARKNGVTLCYYLADDAGRREFASGLGSKLRRRVPDPSGRYTAALVAGMAAAASGLCMWMMGSPLVWICALPLGWGFAMQLLGRLYSLWIKPRPLLKMKVKAVPQDARSLVVLPVLLSSVQRAGEMVSRLEELGCLEKDENIDFLLLGDFRDAPERHAADDENILSAARKGVAELNMRAGREKYFYLHRGRSLRERDASWMGEGRKRGALMALNRLILNDENAREAFGAECAAADRIAGAYRYVITLDADTQYLPGTLQKLIGIMLHPLNGSYAVLQPCMQTTISSVSNAYAALTAGSCGVDGYPASVSDFYQDMCGRGNFSGKGIYDVRAFAGATCGALPEEEILSHDLIEGILAGAAFVGDVNFYDGSPDNLSGELRRLHRWTRGDWQLLRVLFTKRGIRAVDRLKMAGNLLRSLHAPALLVLFTAAVWLDLPGAFLLGLLAAYADGVLAPSRAKAWKACTLRLSVLPATAVTMMDAALRALWRLFVSRKHLLDWVPAADASGQDGKLRIYGRIAAILLLPGLLRPFWIPAALGLAMLFWVGADWADDLAGRSANPVSALNEGQKKLLRTLARETWNFFETFVQEDGPGLPPDNVQFDPPAGAAARTSPTNIGLYLMSCVSAFELGMLDRKTMEKRMKNCVVTLEKLEKWNGQLYNWYDTAALLPLRPRYVSSVDSGNLAGALLLCSRAVEGELAGRMQRLACEMRLDALYDRSVHLFRIGADVENGRLSGAHYDLYASESRILSYVAMMLGQVPLKHWMRLSRPAVRIGKRCVPASWSGTMFEYLMPELMLRSCGDSLAWQAGRNIVRAQMDFAAEKSRPWGISESGYHAFDLQLNYQYRAFGLKAAALSTDTAQDVVAPYAGALALCCMPWEAAENLKRMRDMGWFGEYGMYEAADYRNGEEARLVKSCMAHHQGMLLCAVCNALCGDALPRKFMQIPEARALRLLLEEKMIAGPRMRGRQERPLPRQEEARRAGNFRRTAKKERIAEIQLLQGGGTSAAVTAGGAVHAWRGEIQLSRFSGELSNHHEGMYVHIEDMKSGERRLVGASRRAQFDAGSARITEELDGLTAQLDVCISPENGAIFQKISLENGGGARELAVTGCFAVALGKAADMRAHPTFQHLFVESSWVENGLAFHRRPRGEGAAVEDMVYIASREAEAESDLEKLTGRTGSTGCSGGITGDFSGSSGHVLNPCAALRCRLRLAPGEKKELHFVLAVSKDCENTAEILREKAAAVRAMQLAGSYTRSALRHAAVEEKLFRLLQRASALLLDAKLRQGMLCCEMAPAVDRSLLWQAGVSGDRPIIYAEMRDAQEEQHMREIIRVHGFYHFMGLKTDLVLLDAGEGGYRQPLWEALETLISASHLRDMRGVPGGVFMLRKMEMQGSVLDALHRAAALSFNGNAAVRVQMWRMLQQLEADGADEWSAMEPFSQETPDELEFFNGYGGFRDEEYVICLHRGALPPAPWSNIIASGHSGAVLTDRGGGFAWRGNSRSGRLTPFKNDMLHEGWGWMFYLLDENEGRWMCLLPGAVPMTDFTVRFRPGSCRYEGRSGDAAFALEIRPGEQGIIFALEIENRGSRARTWRLAAAVDWLLGTDALDAAMLRCWSHFGACFASGSSGVAYFAADDPRTCPGCDRLAFLGNGDILHPEGMKNIRNGRSGWTLHLPLQLEAGERKRLRFVLGGAADADTALGQIRRFKEGEELILEESHLHISTPDRALNLLANGFLLAQVKQARILARTGLYQPGGAYGFRDQLQDMLPLIYTEPERVREHLLRCAARQFEAGDVLHWWHEPYTGVRTKIRDDMLFLPYVAARYVKITEDVQLMQEQIPFLRDVEIPKGREDAYAQMQPSAHYASLHEHCMRAFRRAAEAGEHGLCLMGGGDWNDGMNRVGIQGRGESIWLTEFAAVCAGEYAEILPVGEDKSWLLELKKRLCEAVEKHGWDGSWYLRAYGDSGEILGGHDSACCRIDVISQAWAVLAGLDEGRCASAMDSAWRLLADEERNIIRLLDPPFDGCGSNPGYIAAYPPGVRENGAQYTHAACWLVLALVLMGDAARAHRALEMLLPVNHSSSRESADIYRVEPYVMAADVYSDLLHPGRGGWTWYTGSAAWMLMAVYSLLGFERIGNKVRLNALLGEWEEAGVTLKYGSSTYELVCRRDAQNVTLDGVPAGKFIELQDDGGRHTAVFPPR